MELKSDNYGSFTATTTFGSREAEVKFWKDLRDSRRTTAAMAIETYWRPTMLSIQWTEREVNKSWNILRWSPWGEPYGKDSFSTLNLREDNHADPS